jgi:hypothetical protein
LYGWHALHYQQSSRSTKMQSDYAVHELLSGGLQQAIVNLSVTGVAAK